MTATDRTEPGVCPRCGDTRLIPIGDGYSVNPCPNCTSQQPTQLLAKHQPCGCIVCTCEDDLRCHGCGARHCGTHPVSEIPNAVYEQPAQPGSGDVVPRSRYNAANKDWLDEKAAHEKTRQAAADEINRLQAALTAAQQRIAALEGDSK